MMVFKLECIAVLALVIVIDCCASIEIERGDHDTFENPTCLNQTGCNCNGLNAYCIASSCVECKCSGDYKTFLPSVGKHGSCVKDRYLLFQFPIDTNSFQVEDTKNLDICLKHYRPSNFPNSYFVIGTTCNSTDPAQRWIWTQYNQLLNLDTLKCLQQSTFSTTYTYAWRTYNYNYLILGNCNTTDRKQIWHCDNRFMSNSYKYMSHGVHESDILAGPFFWHLLTTWQRRSQSGATLCSKAFGCDEFSNPSSAIFVTDISCTQCQGETQINLPQNHYSCNIVWDQSKFLDSMNYDGWKQLPFTETIFTVVEHGVHTYLKWNFTNASYKWNGLIVKLQFSCTDWSVSPQVRRDRCVLIKFKEKHTDPMTPSPPEPSTRVVSTKPSTITKTPTSGTLLTTASTPQTTKSDEIIILRPTSLSPRPTSLSPRPTSSPSPTDASSPLTSTMSNTTGVRERRTSEPLNVMSIVVPLVVIILVLCGILGFICYRRRRSHAKDSPTANAQDSNDKGGSSVRQTSADTFNPIYSPVDSSIPPYYSDDGGIYHEPTSGASDKGGSSVRQTSADMFNPIYSPVDSSIPPYYSDDGGVYHEPTSGASQECDLYESVGDHDYDYAKVAENNHRAPLPEETYDYVNSNDIRPVAQPK